MCDGCENQKAEGGCKMYAYPELQHTRKGGCAGRTHNKTKVVDDFKVNPLKASKRSMGK